MTGIILSFWVGIGVAVGIYYAGYLAGRYAEAHDIAVRRAAPKGTEEQR